MSYPPPYEEFHREQQTDTQQQQQQTTVMIQPNPSASHQSSTRGSWKGLQITGYLHVVLGIVSVLFGILASVYKVFLYAIGIPIWTGIIFYIVTGVLGIAAGGKQRHSLVIGYMTMSIITAVAGCAVCVTHGIGVTIGGFQGCPDFGAYYSPFNFGCSSTSGTRAAINGLISALGVTEMIVAIVGASLCCCTFCCVRTPSQVVTYTPPQQGMAHFAVPPEVHLGNVVYPPHQVAMYPTQPQYPVQAIGQVMYPPTTPGQAQALPQEKPPLP
ncbi:uncharacterized protein LOC110978332 [Acanthaster planci]|uniref:Uncharacterized protein LOC110978332 n=1 Tax=Acanthaster planci TaxID=133434 RepID=A0A8B7Y6V5_ACAPL|nr:uncharacterized protein LOC110978332 [Acanthaster planci]XP_022088948.1 uncharacterized protein LOC110978332 [Acanthaster planci]